MDKRIYKQNKVFDRQNEIIAILYAKIIDLKIDMEDMTNLWQTSYGTQAENDKAQQEKLTITA